MDSKGHRFLIDKIDSKLGSVDKELKFDKVAIAVGVVLLIAFILVLIFCTEARPLLTVVSILVIIFASYLTYFMINEYLADLKKK
jgi:hypothetical protein